MQRGRPGRWEISPSTLSNGQVVDHGVVILATGAESLQPEGMYLYKEHPNVLLSLELDQELADEQPRSRMPGRRPLSSASGSRIPERPYCSRVCCSHSVENALKLKEINPEMEVYILYRDMRTYGEREILYQQARERRHFYPLSPGPTRPWWRRRTASGLP